MENTKENMHIDIGGLQGYDLKGDKQVNQKWIGMDIVYPNPESRSWLEILTQDATWKPSLKVSLSP